MSFFISLFSFFNLLNFQVVWKDTMIEIPLYEDIYTYQETPYAELYQYGVKLNDPYMFYEYNGVERTFYHLINASHIGTYTVKYKVHFPSYNQTSIQLITFRVVDLFPPEFIKTPSFKIHIGSPMPKVLEGVIYRDNYDSIDQLTLSADTSRVVLNRIGIYPITYHLKDLSGNESVAISELEIYDDEAPTIEKLKPIYINVGERFDYTSYYKIKDNVDLFLNVDIDTSHINFYEIGSYDFSMKVTDQSNLSTIFHDVIHVVDHIKPTLLLTSQTIIMDYGSFITEAHLRSFILGVSDNYDNLSMDDVDIMHDIESFVLGTYKVYYELNDSSNNVIKESLTIQIKDLSPPTIDIIKELKLPVFSDPPLLYDYIEVKDLYNHFFEIDIKITSAIKMNVVGHYQMTIKATDTSKNETMRYLYFEVYDDIPPNITLKQDIVITEFKKISFIHYFDISDQYDPFSDLNIWFDDEHIDYEKVGYYPLMIYAEDRSQNLKSLEIEVLVVDIEPPILNLKQHHVYLNIDQGPIDLRTYIFEAYDTYDELSLDDVDILSDVIYHQIGWYEVLYTLRDDALNETTQKLIILIEDVIKPMIHVEYIEIYPNPSFNPLDYVYATDNDRLYGPIMCACEGIDFSIPGEKSFYVYAKDERGNLTESIMTVYVIPFESEMNYLAYLPILVILVLGSTSILIMRRYNW